MDLIEKYCEAFGRKDLSTISSLLDKNITLQDPIVGKIYGKIGVLNIFKKMFDQFKIDFKVKKIYSSSNYSFAVEFYLILIDEQKKETTVEGVDLIQLSENKIISIRAYLDTSVNATHE